MTQPAKIDTHRPEARLLRLHVIPAARLPELADELDALGRLVGAPFTASKEWLDATWSSVEPHEMWAVIVRNQRGALSAAVVVLEQARGEHQVVTLADAHLGFRGSILAVDEGAAALLGYGLRRQLQYRQMPTVAMLGPVSSDTVGLAEFSSNLGDAEIHTVDPIPMISRAESAAAGDYLTASMRRTLRKAQNRLNTDSRAVRTAFTDRPAQIRAAIPALHRLHLDRDHSRGLTSFLDSAADATIWQRRLLGMADRGALELATMEIDGALAAYVLSVRAGEVLNVLEGVLDPQWSRYAPGRLLETALLQRMLDDPALTTLDWTSPTAPESLLAANGSTPISVVTATAVPVTANTKPARAMPAPRGAHDALDSAVLRSRASTFS